jgi:hypothetical protein
MRSAPRSRSRKSGAIGAVPLALAGPRSAISAPVYGRGNGSAFADDKPAQGAAAAATP